MRYYQLQLNINDIKNSLFNKSRILKIHLNDLFFSRENIIFHTILVFCQFVHKLL